MSELRTEFLPTQFTVDDELKHASIIRELMHGDHTKAPFKAQFFADNARIFYDSNPTDPVTYPNNECYMGLKSLAKMNSDYREKGFTYVVEIHSIYSVGPMVVVTRTDYRKEEGKADIAFPAVGVFVFKSGKIIEWSDYYR